MGGRQTVIKKTITAHFSNENSDNADNPSEVVVAPVTSHAISPCAYVNFSLVEKLNSRAQEFFSRLEHFETRLHP